MTDPRTGDVPIADFPLPQHLWSGWKAAEIIYTFYTYDPADPQGTVHGAPRSLQLRRTDVEAFVRERLKSPDVPHQGYIRHRDPEDHWPVPDRPIDIYVGRPCYVVIELDRKLPWQFRPGHPAITSWDDNFDDNGALHHLMPDGRIVGGEGPPGEGCRIAWFGVNRRCHFEHQKFVCHIVPAGVELRDPVSVDPDIPNDGGKFPFLARLAGQ
ncbi:MAG: hypothetical protein IR159_04895 [Brevundimonas sp.]|nr:hypothetical protein [Brevundimonas sp.]